MEVGNHSTSNFLFFLHTQNAAKCKSFLFLFALSSPLLLFTINLTPHLFPHFYLLPPPELLFPCRGVLICLYLSLSRLNFWKLNAQILNLASILPLFLLQFNNPLTYFYSVTYLRRNLKCLVPASIYCSPFL